MKNITYKKGAVAALTIMIAGTAATAYAMGPGYKADLTEEQKTVLDQARELKQSGDYEGARELMQEAGFEKFGTGNAERKAERMAHRDEVRAAIESNDYEAFESLVGDRHEVTEEIFAKISEAHELRASGDYEGAREIMDELGFGKHKGGMHRGSGMNR